MSTTPAPIRVTVWGENLHEHKNALVRSIYPDGMHTTIARGITSMLGSNVAVRTATLDQPAHGLTDEVLANTDVMTWWGHMGHNQVSDEIVNKVHQRVLEGMGLIVLHSGHYAKVFKKLMGTGCGLKWREAGERERLWVVKPGHPIVDGLGEYFELPNTEMYGEFFDIPQPDELIFISWFEGGEVFRSGCTWNRGKGKVFYFRPGHETFPICHDKNVQLVIANAVRWAHQPKGAYYSLACPNAGNPPSPIQTKYTHPKV